jgi:branched-chain amino acid transport system permease protein
MNAISPSSAVAASATKARAAWWRTAHALPLAVLLLLALMPWCLGILGLDYYLGFVRRLLIVVLAVAALDLLVGNGGLVALGHAGFMGVGAYALAAGMESGMTSAWGLWVIAPIVAGVFAALIGAVALRTRGVYFIMITLAFAQMLYYLAVTLRMYGGDDGYNLPQRPELGFGLSIGNEATFYWVVLGLVVLGWWLLQRLIASPFGHVLSAARDNETRTSALGYPVYYTRLVAFMLAGALAGLAGALMLTHNGFVSPMSMHWSSSAILLVMLVLGGTGHRWGPVLGVGIWMVVEEALRQWTDYWHWPIGAMLIAVALLAPRGVAALCARIGDRNGSAE